jgi:hypothetical protein
MLKLAEVAVDLDKEPVYLVTHRGEYGQILEIVRTATEVSSILAFVKAECWADVVRIERKPAVVGLQSVAMQTLTPLTRSAVAFAAGEEYKRWNQRPCIVGSISSDTMLMSDTLPAMHNLAMALFDQYGAHVSVDVSYVRLLEIENEIHILVEKDEADPENLLGELYDELDGIINSFLPRGFYFGTAEGDGACLGVWSDEEE